MGYQDFYQLIPIPNPGAGQGATYKIPGETWVRVLVAHAKLVTSAAVANRIAVLEYQDGDGNPFARWSSSSAQAASLTGSYTWSPDAGTTDVGGVPDQQINCSGAILYPGYSIRFSAFALDAADQFSQLSLYVCRYPSGEWASSPGATPYSPDVIGYIG